MIRSPSRPEALRRLETLLEQAAALATIEASRGRVWAALRDVVSSMPDDHDPEHDEHWRSTYDAWKTRADDDDPGSIRGRSEPLRFRCLECEWQGRGVFAQAAHYQQTGHRTRAWSRGVERETQA